MLKKEEKEEKNFMVGYNLIVKLQCQCMFCVSVCLCPSAPFGVKSPNLRQSKRLYNYMI